MRGTSSTGRRLSGPLKGMTNARAKRIEKARAERKAKRRAK